jgi:hypothetical protein
MLPGGVRSGIALLASVLAMSGCAWLERSSVSSAPANAAGNGPSRGPSLSQSGRYVAFASSASNLVVGDTNDASDVFVRDNVTHITTRVSVATDGTQGNSASIGADISDDGRYVSFLSAASNLAPGDTDTVTDVFVRDRVAHTTEVASVGSDETAIAAAVTGAVISGDGRTVAFTVLTGFIDVQFTLPYGPLVRHLDAGTTSNLMIQPPLGSAATMPGPLSLSDDGRRIASIPYRLNGQTADGTATVRDTTTGAVIATLGSVSVPIVTNRVVPLALSGDGQWFAIGFVPPPDDPLGIGAIRVGRVDDVASARSVASVYTPELALSDSGSVLGTRTSTIYGDVAMVADPKQGAFRLVSSNATGTNVVIIGTVAFSGDGRWVAFDSAASDVAPGDAHGVTQVYTRSVARSASPPA